MNQQPQEGEKVMSAVEQKQSQSRGIGSVGRSGRATVGRSHLDPNTAKKMPGKRAFQVDISVNTPKQQCTWLFPSLSLQSLSI